MIIPLQYAPICANSQKEQLVVVYHMEHLHINSKKNQIIIRFYPQYYMLDQKLNCFIQSQS